MPWSAYGKKSDLTVGSKDAMLARSALVVLTLTPLLVLVVLTLTPLLALVVLALVVLMALVVVLVSPLAAVVAVELRLANSA
jgi:hypothetical protein